MKRANFPLALSFACADRAEAQFLGRNFPGDYGLFSGSQAPPGRYAGVYSRYYTSNTIKLEDGVELPQGYRTGFEDSSSWEAWHFLFDEWPRTGDPQNQSTMTRPWGRTFARLILRSVEIDKRTANPRANP